nr:MAG TPA: hypothetical protein [Caudoviricetes sp.]
MIKIKSLQIQNLQDKHFSVSFGDFFYFESFKFRSPKLFTSDFNFQNFRRRNDLMIFL